jgi:hypothetical protein
VREKGFTPIIILLVLVGIGFLAYFGYFYKSSTQPSPEATSSSISMDTPSPLTPTASTTPDPTANWKTYTDPGDSYTYKYPSGLFPKENATYQGMIYFYPSLSAANNGGGAFGEALFYIQVTVADKAILPESNSSSAYSGKYKDTQGRIWATDGPIWGEGDSSNYQAEIKYGDKYYSVGSQFYGRKLGNYLNKELIVQSGNSYSATQLIEEQNNIMHQILSTFKFTQ